MDGKASLKGAWLSHVIHLNFPRHNHIPGMADRHCHCCVDVVSLSLLRRCIDVDESVLAGVSLSLLGGCIVAVTVT